MIKNSVQKTISDISARQQICKMNRLKIINNIYLLLFAIMAIASYIIRLSELK